MEPIFRSTFYFLFIINLIIAESADIGNTIPDLKIRLLDGTTTTIHELVDDGPLMIDFWATWCVPCKKLMRYLDQYHQDYSSDGFKVLMINTDTPRSMGKVKSYVRAQDYKFYIGMDPNKTISKKLNGMVMPTMILVDKGGEVKWRHQGYISGEEIEVNNQIKQLLENNLEEIFEG